MKSTIFLTILLAIAGLSINAQNNSQLISYPKKFSVFPIETAVQTVKPPLKSISVNDYSLNNNQINSQNQLLLMPENKTDAAENSLLSGDCVSCPGFDYSFSINTSWETHASSIELNACKMYRFTVISGNTYTFKTGCGDGATANFNTYLELINNTCNTVIINDDACENNRSSITWTANYSGYAFLKVRGLSSSFGKYTLAYKYTSTCGTCVSCPNYDYNYTPGSNWQTHASAIASNGCKIYRFSVSNGNTYTFKTGCGDGATASFDTYLEMYNGNCSILANDDDGCENYRSSITWSANYTGYVYLKVRGYEYSAGTYTLGFKQAPTGESCVTCPNFDYSDSPSANWITHASGIIPFGCKIYRFPVISGNVYTFKTGCGDGATANFDTYLELLNSSCNPLTSNDDGCENYLSTITWTANYSGYVYLKVKGYSSSAGNYTLAYKYNGTCGPCASCPNYDYNYTISTTYLTHASSIEANACKMYRFFVTSGNTYNFKTGCGDGATANFNTELELYSNYCSLIAANDDGCENLRSSISWTANFTGYVYLKVKGHGASSGKYTLAFRNTGSCGPCNNCPNYDYSYIPISNYLTHASSISPNGCKMYRFEVISGNTYHFKTGCGDGATADFDTYLELLNNNCVTLAGNDDACENYLSAITWTANYSGYVFLKVAGYGSSSGSYSLAYNYASAWGSCASCPDFDYNLPTATYWQAHCTSILSYGCKIYRFPVTTGNTYTFKTGCGDGATADFNTFLELFNGNCSTIALNDDGCENLRSSVTWTSSYSGFVYLKVRGIGASAGTYNMAFRHVSPYGSCVNCPNYDYISSPGTAWQTHCSGILPNGCKMYRFPVTIGNTYTFKTGCGDGATADFNTFLELFNSNCSTVAIDDDGCEFFRSSITWLATYSGYVYLKVSGVGSSSGIYNLSFRYEPACGSCVSCPNYDFNITPSNAWELHTSNIMVNGCKMYRFWVTSGNNYTFKTGCGDGATANFDTYLELYNNNCSSITSNDDACENYRSSINWTAGYTGYVYLKVKGWGTSGGSYSLAYRYSSSCGSCVSCPNYDYNMTPATSWGIHCAGILPYGCKMYRFPVTYGQTYTFKTGCGDGATANFNTFLELFNSSCSIIALNDDGCENLRSSISWVADYTGYVYLKVSGVGASSGSYNLSYRYEVTCSSCVSCPNYDYQFTPAASWGLHSSGILPNGCKMYRFWITGGQIYTFKTGCGDGATANFDTYLELYNGNCSLLMNNDDGCESLRSSITWPANFTGYVYLKVRGWGSCSGTYNLAFRNNSVCGSMPVDAYMQTIAGNAETVCGLGAGSYGNETNKMISEGQIAKQEDGQKLTGINVYPNPGNGRFSIVIDNGLTAKCQIVIYNAFGQIILKENDFTLDEHSSVDISDELNGIYYVHIRIGAELFRQKLIIQR